MTEIRFYHLQYQPQAQVLSVILSKALERGHRIVVKMRDEAEIGQMNDYLWTFSPDSFLPHGSVRNGQAEMQPIWLTTEDESPNKADVLILCQGAYSEKQSEFALCCEMLDGHDQQAISDARTRWKTYKDQGFDVTYWQQGETGGWEKKA
ncbi:MAG: DNA polymerase III subunit chi [Zetaproteobacteria bacterium]|nr:MAG: DNA polymerase III subunit chi [Zetaproteobacteria bacterium]